MNTRVLEGSGVAVGTQRGARELICKPGAVRRCREPEPPKPASFRHGWWTWSGQTHWSSLHPPLSIQGVWIKNF